MNAKHGDEFECTLNPQINLKDYEYIKQFDVVHSHLLIAENNVDLVNWMQAIKDNGIPLILDIDDHWDLSPTHPMYGMYTSSHLDELIQKDLRMADCVTTTTDLFAGEIKPLNENVVVLPNAIDPESEYFQTKKAVYLPL